MLKEIALYLRKLRVSLKNCRCTVTFGTYFAHFFILTCRRLRLQTWNGVRDVSRMFTDWPTVLHILPLIALSNALC